MFAILWSIASVVVPFWGGLSKYSWTVVPVQLQLSLSYLILTVSSCYFDNCSMCFSVATFLNQPTNWFGKEEEVGKKEDSRRHRSQLQLPPFSKKTVSILLWGCRTTWATKLTLPRAVLLRQRKIQWRLHRKRANWVQQAPLQAQSSTGRHQPGLTCSKGRR